MAGEIEIDDFGRAGAAVQREGLIERVWAVGDRRDGFGAPAPALNFTLIRERLVEFAGVEEVALTVDPGGLVLEGDAAQLFCGFTVPGGDFGEAPAEGIEDRGAARRS